MFVRRKAGLVALLVGLTVTASACAGDDSVDVPEGSASPSAARDADGFTAEEREVVDRVDAFLAAFWGRGDEPIGPAVEGLITDEFAQDLVPAEERTVDEADKQRLGPYTFDPESVTIDGDEAEVVGCLDLSLSFVVDAGDTEVGAGARASGESNVVSYGMERVDGEWRVAYPFGEGERC